MATFSETNFAHASYAALRPAYPSSLYDRLLQYHKGPTNVVVDLGTGPGIAARALSVRFARVIATDPAPGMIAEAKRCTPKSEYGNITYRIASAESLPFIQDGQADMVVAGQAAHWFEYTRVFDEMRRILRPNGTLAFWGYKDHVFVDHPRATAISNRFSHAPGPDFLGDYWPQPGRSMVENQYRDIHPPPAQWSDVQRHEYEPGMTGSATGVGTQSLIMAKNMTLAQYEAYLRTSSAYHAWLEHHTSTASTESSLAPTAKGTRDVVDRLSQEMIEAEPDWKRSVEEEKEIMVQVEWGSCLILARNRQQQILD